MAKEFPSFWNCRGQASGSTGCVAGAGALAVPLAPAVPLATAAPLGTGRGGIATDLGLSSVPPAHDRHRPQHTTITTSVFRVGIRHRLSARLEESDSI